MNKLVQKRNQRTKRVRKGLKRVASRPRLSIFRSNKYIWAQIIDDNKGETIASATDRSLKDTKGTKTDKAAQIGEKIAELALKKKVKQVYFDRGASKYHGRVKALAEAARKKGLEF